ncbi:MULTISPECIES: o-succinylbenzoate--CoA ligase [Microbacterium]|uniref:o-succinylbenzoate--CoA ligase n=1 Tax=Microbacterium TaxID=33882 RepID=UPI0007686FC2|nr:MULTISPECIES: o-succinylbenzoate--CoA ligase [Microbacterium]KXC05909.1 AMP-dependent synthetase [Microbacterium hominis]QOC27074.1 o-succinylbenzoate--CoA ligase [Microbacterium hominis]QOC28231.1 o-succinylbenzoate--CoA ligase [Microbacterium hominis]QYF96590.1 o-succinylbenzoate--CoA ligase [Microbacterium sp. PAMC21962]
MNDRGLGSWIAKRRLKCPDKTALVFGAHALTYAELADLVDRVAALLAERGVQKGDAVAYLGENSPDFLAVLFGCARLGAVFVPVNTRLAAPEIRHVLTDSSARVLIHDVELAERVVDGVEAARIAHVLLTGDGAPGIPGLDRLRSAAGRRPVEAEIGLDDPAIVMYTSGTTGRAKGAVLTHGNLTWSALNCIVDYDVVSTDVALMISPLFHAASLGMGALPVIMKGATMVLEPGFDAGRALELVQRHRVSMLSGVPTTYQLMADHPDWDRTDVSSLRKLTCGGSAVPTRILDAYERRGLSFSQGYGMTEGSPGVTSLAPEATTRKQGSVGLPHFFTEIRIADENGMPVAPGTVGEIEVTGPNVFAGYLNLPEESAAVFTDDGWFRSGDLGYVDADGYLFIADRLKDMIISGGENIYPAEVENLINDIRGISGVAVIGVPDERWGEVPWAVVTVRDGQDVSTASVRAALDGVLARYKLPKNVVVVEELPRTASGKIRKADLRARFGRRH